MLVDAGGRTAIGDRGATSRLGRAFYRKLARSCQLLFPARDIWACTEVKRMTESPFGSVDARQNPLEALIEVLTAVTRYDLALGVIPFAFIGSVVASATADLSLTQALVPATLVGILVIVDVCYRNPPTET
jgi:hypothetical protein